MSLAEKCYKLLKRVPKGRITTYAELARGAKSKAYRAVGQAMARNPNAPKVPCHRVVRSDGTIGGYAFGTTKKISILKREGITVKNGKVSDFEKKLFRFR